MKKLFLLIIFMIPMVSFQACKKDSDPAEDKNAAVIEQMKSVTDSLINSDQHIPGILALVVDRNKGIDWLYKVGVSDIPGNLPMNEENIFRIGSNTKTMTGTVLLQLVDEGKLHLEDKVSEYFPAFPMADSITIKMLCNMTSGYFNYSDSPRFTAINQADPHHVWQPMELVQLALDTIRYFPPGTDFHYSNTNTIILGMLIEKLTNSTLQTEITNRIYVPLGLQNTGFLTNGVMLPGIHGRGYYDGSYVPGTDMTEVFDISWAWAAGSAYSTPHELQKYVEAVTGDYFLSDTLQQRRMTDMIESAFGGYGLCLLHQGSFYGHNGGCPGFTSSMYHSNLRNCTIIIYFNCQLGYQPDKLFRRFATILYGQDF